VLIADVSEHSIGSIFKGRSMKYDWVWDVWGNIYRTGFRQVGGRANGKVSSRLGVVRGGGVYKACAGGITVLYSVAVSFS
jgi:hypothetical protein